jgi:hypothetical protein
VAWLIDETEKRGYDVKPGQTWGYACRAIRGSSSPSNHSWALAIDINAPTNPMGSRLITDMPAWMPKLWEAHGFRWGGTYRSRPDAMHYEFMLTPADAARIIRDIEKGRAPAQVEAKLPLKLPPKGDKNYMKGKVVKDVQNMINGWILLHQPIDPGGNKLRYLNVDGVYGMATAVYITLFKRWVIALQKAFKLPVWPNDDSKVGPVTYSGLQFWSHN